MLLMNYLFHQKFPLAECRFDRHSKREEKEKGNAAERYDEFE